MLDAGFKKFFSSPRLVELLIRAHVPEWSDSVDFQTLRKLPTEFIARPLLRRLADMIWWARKTDGKTQVAFLLEIQGHSERHMALRTTEYATLLLTELGEHADFGPEGGLPEVVVMVLHHGDRPWNAPTRLSDLFRHSSPSEYRVVSRRPWNDPAKPTPSDLPAMVLELSRDWAPAELRSHLAALRVVIRQAGDVGFHEYMAECVGALLVSRGYSDKELLAEVSSMDGMSARWNQGIDEMVRQRYGDGIPRSRAQAIERGIERGQVMLLRRQTARKFGSATAHELDRLLDGRSDPDHLARIADVILECDSGEDFIARVQSV